MFGEARQTARQETIKNPDGGRLSGAPPREKREKLRFNLFDLWATGNFDIPFFVLVMLLLVTGLVMMFSASYVRANYEEGDSFYYIKRQLLWTVVGFAVMLAVSRVNYLFLRRFAVPFFAVSFALLILVLIFPVQIPGKEEIKRWLGLPGTPLTFQPSDVMKFALILFFAHIMDKYRDLIEKKAWSFWVLILFVAAPCVLVLYGRHLSGTILIFCVGIAMIFLGGANKFWFIVLGSMVIAIAIVVIKNPDILEKIMKTDYMSKRIIAWTDKDYSPLDSRWQINQSLNAIGSGGLFGLGLGASRQKFLYISEAHNDFVFAVVCEELGFIRVMLILLLFAALIFRGFIIGTRARDRFGSLLCTGIVFQIGLQAALNIAVVTDTIPNTGIGLPFFSYGGTALVMLLAQIGVVLSISRTAKLTR